LEGILSLIAALLAVAFVIYLSYLFSRYISMGSAKINGARHMRIIDRLMVGQDRFLLIVGVMDKVLLVSVTSQAISVLGELNSDDFKDEFSEEHKGFFENSFKSVLQNIMKPKK